MRPQWKHNSSSHNKIGSTKLWHGAAFSVAYNSTATRQICGKPTSDSQLLIATGEARYTIPSHCDSVPGVSHYRAIIGGDAIKLRGGPSFNFDETGMGSPQWRTAGEEVQYGSHWQRNSRWLAKDPCLQMETLFDRGTDTKAPKKWPANPP